MKQIDDVIDYIVGHKSVGESASLFSSISKDRLTDLADADKVGENGIVIIAPWSYRINALLRKYFEKQLLLIPPIPSPNTTILILTSNHVFQDYYVSFPSNHALTILESVFSFIQKYGISPLLQTPIREGLTIQATSSSAGSSVGYRF